MGNKAKRFAAIQQIIATSTVGSQEELLSILSTEGFHLTQATLSRDLKQMKVSKTTNASGEYVYQLPAPELRGAAVSDIQKFSSGHAFTSIAFSQNMAVIHTRPGYASGLASEIDELATHVIIGTVAGDDTILAVIKESVTKQDVLDALSSFIPDLKM